MPDPADRRRIEEVFGHEPGEDRHDDAPGEGRGDRPASKPGADPRDDWYRENRPPHHDR